MTFDLKKAMHDHKLCTLEINNLMAELSPNNPYIAMAATASWLVAAARMAGLSKKDIKNLINATWKDYAEG